MGQAGTAVNGTQDGPWFGCKVVLQQQYIAEPKKSGKPDADEDKKTVKDNKGDNKATPKKATDPRAGAFFIQVAVSGLILIFAMGMLIAGRDENVYLPLVTAMIGYWLPSPTMKEKKEDPSKLQQQIALTALRVEFPHMTFLFLFQAIYSLTGVVFCGLMLGAGRREPSKYLPIITAIVAAWFPSPKTLTSPSSGAQEPDGKPSDSSTNTPPSNNPTTTSGAPAATTMSSGATPAPRPSGGAAPHAPGAPAASGQPSGGPSTGTFATQPLASPTVSGGQPFAPSSPVAQPSAVTPTVNASSSISIDVGAGVGAGVPGGAGAAAAAGEDLASRRVGPNSVLSPTAGAAAAAAAAAATAATAARAAAEGAGASTASASAMPSSSPRERLPPTPPSPAKERATDNDLG